MRFRIIATVVALALGSCAREPEPPVHVEPSQVEALLEHSRDLDGRRVSVDGYVHIDDDSENGGIAMVYTLMSRPRGLGDEVITFEAERGTGANRLDLPVLKTERLPDFAGGSEVLTVDLTNARFIDGAGTAHPIRSKVRVTGVLASGPPLEDARAPAGKRYRPRLTDVAFEAAP